MWSVFGGKRGREADESICCLLVWRTTHDEQGTCDIYSWVEHERAFNIRPNSPGPVAQKERFKTEGKHEKKNLRAHIHTYTHTHHREGRFRTRVQHKTRKRLTDKLVVLALLEGHTDVHVGDDVVGEDVVLGVSVVAGDVGCVASFVGVNTVWNVPRKTRRNGTRVGRGVLREKKGGADELLARGANSSRGGGGHSAASRNEIGKRTGSEFAAFQAKTLSTRDTEQSEISIKPCWSGRAADKA